MSRYDVYVDQINGCVEYGSKNYINIPDTVCASRVVEKLFRIAAGKMYIVADYLRPEIYGHPYVREAADSFLKVKGNEIRLILTPEGVVKDAFSENGFLSFLMRQKPVEKTKLFYMLRDMGRPDAEASPLEDDWMVMKTLNNTYALFWRFKTKSVNDYLAGGCFNAETNGEKLFGFSEKSIASEKLARVPDARVPNLLAALALHC